MYAYAGNNPVKYTDPDGRLIKIQENADPKDIEAYEKAILYLSKSERAKQIIQELQASPIIFTIVFNDDDFDAYMFDSQLILWDSDSGLVTGVGDVQSAALGLIHEMGHAEQYINGKFKDFPTDKEKGDILKKSLEEENLEKTENVVASQLIEPKRKSYDDSVATRTMKDSTHFIYKDYDVQKKFQYYYNLYAPKIDE